MKQVDVTSCVAQLVSQFLILRISCNGVLYSQVLVDCFNGRVGHECIEVLFAGKDAVVIQSIHVSIVVAVELFLYGLVEVGQSFRRNFRSIQRDQHFGNLAVYFMVVVLVVDVGEFLFQCFQCFGNVLLVVLLQSGLQFIEGSLRCAEFDTAAERFAEVSIACLDRHNPFDVFVNLSDHLFIICITLFLGILCKTAFLFSFRFQYFIVHDGLVHADGVFPVVA